MYAVMYAIMYANMLLFMLLCIHNGIEDFQDNLHYVKSVRIRSYSGLHYPVFGLNTERYSVSLHI